MAFVGLVSDSTAAIPSTWAARYGIRIVPLYVKIGTQNYRDGVDITPEEFYQRLPHTNPMPTTSQPSAGDLAAAYRELAEQGASAIISVHLSEGISGTINSATLAAQQVGVPVEIVDTRCAAAAHRLAVEAGARALAAGANAGEAVQAIRKVIEAQKTLFLVDTLEYLYKGGRIGGASALLGSLLQFKPLLYFNDGKIDALERVRKSSRALNRLVEVMADWVGDQQPVRALAMQAAASERAEAALHQLGERIQVADAQVTPLTPVIGTHVGNGTVGLCCCPVALCGKAED